MEQIKTQALLAMARAYYDRGNAVQYDQRSMDRVLELTPRRRKRMPPEYANSQEVLFLDCSSYVSAIYYQTFGYELPSDLTWHMIDYVVPRIFFYEPTHEETPEFMDSMEKEVRGMLQPGDLITIERVGGNGHVMMYMGDNQFTDCTPPAGMPNSYDYTQRKNNMYEHGGIWLKSADRLFEKDEGETLRRYSIFCAVTRRVSIARPMDLLGDPLPQALVRLEGAKDLWCSVENSAPGLTQVRPGDRVNYRVTVRNQGEQRRPVTVTFSPPAGTVLCRKDRTEQTLEGGEEAHFLFAAEVNADYSTDWIDGPKVTVNGLEIYAHRVLVGTTLSEKEAEALSREVRESVEGGMTALAAAAQAYGARGIRMEENESRWCFTHFCFHDSTKGDVLSRRPQRPKTDLAVYSGFGGKGVITPEMGSADGMRATLIRRRDLMPGDVVLCWEDSFGNQGCSAYYDGNALIGRFEAGEETKIFTGEQIDAFLDTLFGRFAFLILRPWQGR